MRLREVLNGTSEGPPPEEWIISRVCEEFHCLPSQAVRELEHGDAPLLFTILELRAYARAKAELDSTDDQSKVKVTPAIALVCEIEAEAFDNRST